MALDNYVRKESLRRRLRKRATNVVAAGLIGLGALGVTACPNPAGPSTDNGSGQEEENEDEEDNGYESSVIEFSPSYDFPDLDSVVHDQLEEVDDGSDVYNIQHNEDPAEVLRMSLAGDDFARAEWELDGTVKEGDSVEYDINFVGDKDLNVTLFNSDSEILDTHEYVIRGRNESPSSPESPDFISEDVGSSGDVEVEPRPSNADINGDDVTYHLSGDPDFMSIDSSTGVISWEDAGDHSGTAEAYITDSHGAESDRAQIELNFSDDPDAYQSSDLELVPHDIGSPDPSDYGVTDIPHGIWDADTFILQYSERSGDTLDIKVNEDQGTFDHAEISIAGNTVQRNPGEAYSHNPSSVGVENLVIDIYEDGSKVDTIEKSVDQRETPLLMPDSPTEVSSTSSSGSVPINLPSGDVDLHSDEPYNFQLSDAPDWLGVENGEVTWENAEPYQGTAELRTMNDRGAESNPVQLELDFDPYISSELNHDLNYDFGSETNPTDAYGTTLGSIYDVPDSDGLEAYFDDADFDTNFSGAIDDMYNKHGTMENDALRVFPHVGENTYLDLTVDVEGGYDSIEWYENGTKIGDGENFQYNVDFFDETRELDARVYLNGEEKDRHSIDVEALSNVQPGYPAASGQMLDEFNQIFIDKGETAEYNLVMKDLNGGDLRLETIFDNLAAKPSFDVYSNQGEQCNDDNQNLSDYDGTRMCITPNHSENRFDVFVDTDENAGETFYRIDHTVYDTDDKSSGSEEVWIGYN